MTGLWTSSATAQDEEAHECVTQADRFWLCQGDEAWTTGYLVDPRVFDLRLLPVWREQVEVVLPRLQAERLILRSQRDRFARAAGDLARLLKESQSQAEDLRKTNESLYDTWDLLLTGAGGVGLGLVVGLLALILI